MKTLNELEAERVELVRAIADATTLANERSTYAYRIQSLTTQHALGLASRGDLEKAQRDLTDSVDAIVRRQHLEASLVELDNAIVITRGRERAAYCHSVADEHAAVYADYKVKSKELLELFKQLTTLNNKHMGLTGRQLHGAHENELNLPTVTGPLGNRSTITSGEELVMAR